MEEQIDKKSLSEQDIRTKFINPAIQKAGWNILTQVRENHTIRYGRILAKGTTCKRATDKKLFADYVLFYKPNKPIAIIEAKDNKHTMSAGMQQGLEYANMLDVPFVFSSNGDGFVFHNKYVTEGKIEITISNDEFPSPEQLWKIYIEKEHINPIQEKIINQSYYQDTREIKQPRYYQMVAINRTVEAIANNKQRILLVMATGTGKTYTAFQIIWRLWKAGIKKRILFLVDRNAILGQTYLNDFAPFKDKMTIIQHRKIEHAYEIYLALYQGLTGEEETKNVFKQFSPDFFDLIVVDECHRGSAKENSKWKEILKYFSSATQIGLTATPKETEKISNIEYFGEPIYKYSLKQGIEDGFLAPYRVIRVLLDKDMEGYEPYKGQLDDNGEVIDDRPYNIKDYDKNLVLKKRTELVAKVVSDYLKQNNCRMDKTIFFCVDQEHADRMRTALVNENADLCSENSSYVTRITSDDKYGVKKLDDFRDVGKLYPTLVTTSQLLRTGVDIQTVKFIVLDTIINSVNEFKQIIGRGTRVREDLGKMFFTIFDFRDVTRLFHDPDFDGPIEQDENYKPGGTTTKPPIISEPISHEYGKKFFLGKEPVTILHQQVQYLDKNGKLITESLIDFSKSKLKDKYTTLNNFLSQWNSINRKQIIIEELENQGIFFDELYKIVGKDLDPFDLIMHLAFDKPPLTRKERANNVRKKDYFAKYSDTAKEILEILLEKYADNGIEEIENIDILKTYPLDKYGTQPYIVNTIFGGKDNYIQALKDLETAIYA